MLLYFFQPQNNVARMLQEDYLKTFPGWPTLKNTIVFRDAYKYNGLWQKIMLLLFDSITAAWYSNAEMFFFHSKVTPGTLVLQMHFIFMYQP